MTDFQDVDVLYVEDNPRDVEMTLRSLKRSKLANKIFVVEDGAAALDFLFARNGYAGRANAARPKLVLLDLKLPKVSGLDVLRAIRADASTRSIPVVVLTASQEERDLVESYDLGVNSYLVKPVGFDAFARVVTDVGFYWLAVNKVPT